MIILIGGASHTGKTLLAQRLLEKYKYPYLSIDHLKMGLYRVDMGCGFAPTDSEDHIGEALWPILQGIIMTCIENGQNLIIEGAYLLPQRVSELADEYRKHTISLYLGFSQGYVDRSFESRILGNSCAIEQRVHGDYTAQECILASRRQKELCAVHGAKYFEIDGDYDEEMERVALWISRYALD